MRGSLFIFFNGKLGFGVVLGVYLGFKRYLPCVATGECSDCMAPKRSCNIFTILKAKPSTTNLNVVIVDEDLGLGWGPSRP